MSGFCGVVGKTNNEATQKMSKAIDKNCGYAPIFFSDGLIHLGYVPYMSSDNQLIGHNANFTIWAMADVGCKSDDYVSKIIEAYESKGISFIKDLEGTFSIVLWDGLKRKLYLIRDRYGAKPLFYAKIKDGMVFATELKAILQSDCIAKSINKAAIYQYFSYQSVYLPETVFEGIYQISAGCYGVYSDGKFEETEYSDMPFDVVCEDTFEEATANLQALLSASVNRCIEEDNVGIFLSGGLDSGLVAALAKTGCIKNSFCLKPVTGNDSIHKKDDDVYYSTYLAKTYGIEQHVWEMKPNDLLNDIDEIINSFSQPFSGTMSTYFLAKKTSGICKKIITGDGADELFGSYLHHTVVLPLERYAFYKENDKELIGREKEFVPYDKDISFLDCLYRCAGNADTRWYYHLLKMTDGEKNLYLNMNMFREYINGQYTLMHCIKSDKLLKSKGVLNRSLERDFKHLLPGHTMMYQDTLARSFGINLAMPFMNNELTKYVVTLPQEYKIKEGVTKNILKNVGRRVLPEEIVERRKEPFSLPIAEWMRVDLKEYVTDILCEDSVKRHGLLNPTCVGYALGEFYKYPVKKAYYASTIWELAMVERWAELFM